MFWVWAGLDAVYAPSHWPLHLTAMSVGKATAMSGVLHTLPTTTLIGHTCMCLALPQHHDSYVRHVDFAHGQVVYVHSAIVTWNVCMQSMAVQMQRVHAELKATVWGTWRRHLTEPTAPVPAPSVTRLLEMWDYEASLTIQVTVLTYRGGDHDKW